MASVSRSVCPTSISQRANACKSDLNSLPPCGFAIEPPQIPCTCGDKPLLLKGAENCLELCKTVFRTIASLPFGSPHDSCLNLRETTPRDSLLLSTKHDNCTNTSRSNLRSKQTLKPYCGTCGKLKPDALIKAKNFSEILKTQIDRSDKKIERLTGEDSSRKIYIKDSGTCTRNVSERHTRDVATNTCQWKPAGKVDKLIKKSASTVAKGDVIHEPIQCSCSILCHEKFQEPEQEKEQIEEDNNKVYKDDEEVKDIKKKIEPPKVIEAPPKVAKVTRDNNKTVANEKPENLKKVCVCKSLKKVSPKCRCKDADDDGHKDDDWDDKGGKKFQTPRKKPGSGGNDTSGKNLNSSVKEKENEGHTDNSAPNNQKKSSNDNTQTRVDFKEENHGNSIHEAAKNATINLKQQLVHDIKYNTNNLPPTQSSNKDTKSTNQKVEKEVTKELLEPLLTPSTINIVHSYVFRDHTDCIDDILDKMFANSHANKLLQPIVKNDSKHSKKTDDVIIKEVVEKIVEIAPSKNIVFLTPPQVSNVEKPKVIEKESLLKIDKVEKSLMTAPDHNIEDKVKLSNINDNTISTKTSNNSLKSEMIGEETLDPGDILDISMLTASAGNLVKTYVDFFQNIDNHLAQGRFDVDCNTKQQLNKLKDLFKTYIESQSSGVGNYKKNDIELIFRDFINVFDKIDEKLSQLYEQHEHPPSSDTDSKFKENVLEQRSISGLIKDQIFRTSHPESQLEDYTTIARTNLETKTSEHEMSQYFEIDDIIHILSNATKLNKDTLDRIIKYLESPCFKSSLDSEEKTNKTSSLQGHPSPSKTSFHVTCSHSKLNKEVLHPAKLESNIDNYDVNDQKKQYKNLFQKEKPDKVIVTPTKSIRKTVIRNNENDNKYLKCKMLGTTQKVNDNGITKESRQTCLESAKSFRNMCNACKRLYISQKINNKCHLKNVSRKA